MKIDKDEVYYTLSQVLDAAQLLETSVQRAKRIFESDDCPAPHERFDGAAEAADWFLGDMSIAGDAGIRLQQVVDTLEELGEELPE